LSEGATAQHLKHKNKRKSNRQLWLDFHIFQSFEQLPMRLLKLLALFIGITMSVIFFIILIAFFLESHAVSYLKIKQNDSTSAKDLFIANVHVIPMTSDTVLYDHSVKIVNGRIEDIGVDLEPGNLPVYDAKGGFMTPGLIDMHVHIWDRYELGLYLANGVTAVRNLWGQPMHLRMKEAVHDEALLGPLFFTSSPKLTGPNYPGDDNLQLTTPEEATNNITSYRERGYDFIKTYNGLTPDLYDAVVKRCRELGMDIAAHPSAEVDYTYHFKPEIKTIEHAEDIVQQPLEYELDTAKLRQVASLYAANTNTAICPTLVVYYNIYRLITEVDLLNQQEIDYINPLIRMADSEAQFNRWQGTLANNPDIGEQIREQHAFHLLAIRQIHEAGGKIVCGTDAGIGVTLPGYSMHEELQFYTEAGLSNYEVLKTATVNPSTTHDFLSDMGTLESGKYANLILSTGNPLEDISALQTPSLVVVNGRKIEAETLKKFEEKARGRNNLIPSIVRYVEFFLVEK
jgi:imidazolonepropionase-like amidohydrolase